jgi:hypothetical protein
MHLALEVMLLTHIYTCDSSEAASIMYVVKIDLLDPVVIDPATIHAPTNIPTKVEDSQLGHQRY